MKDEFNLYSKSYQEEINNSIKYFGINHQYIIGYKMNKILDLVNKNFNSIKVLDIGCGMGLGHEIISNKIKKLYGVDSSSESIEIAKKRNKDVIYKYYDEVNLPFEDKNFDVIFTMNTMHHVQKNKWNIFINEICRVLKNNGLFIVIEHNPLNPITQWIVKTNPMDKNANLVWPTNLKKILTKKKFTKIELDYIFSFPIIS